MKRYLKAMGCNELLELIRSNSTLYDELYDYEMSDREYWIDEYLFGMRRGTADYEISCCSYSYFRITDEDGFEEWITYVQNAYGFLNEEEFETAEKYLRYARIFDKLNWVVCKDKDYNKVHRLMNTYKQKTEEVIVDRLTAEYDIRDIDLVDCIDRWMVDKGYEEAYADCGHIYLHQPEVVIEAHEELIA